MQSGGSAHCGPDAGGTAPCDALTAWCDDAGTCCRAYLDRVRAVCHTAAMWSPQKAREAALAEGGAPAAGLPHVSWEDLGIGTLLEVGS